jgi:hypothetical protein
MQATVEQACPRCYQALIAKVVEADPRRVALSCNEPYCDYVLTLTARESARFVRRWTWPTLGWISRLAS